MHFVYYINTFNDVLLAEAKAEQVYNSMYIAHSFDYALVELPTREIVYKIIINVYGRTKKKDKL